MGRANLAQYCSTTIGQNNSATAAWSAAFGGYGNTASNLFATAMGAATVASGMGSTSLCRYTIASGDYSAAFNFSTTAQSYVSATFGQFKLGGGNATTWVSTDPLFEIGNGTSATAKSDALVVYKNGNVAVQGKITIAPGGDIPMYTGM